MKCLCCMIIAIGLAVLELYVMRACHLNGSPWHKWGFIEAIHTWGHDLYDTHRRPIKQGDIPPFPIHDCVPHCDRNGGLHSDQSAMLESCRDCRPCSAHEAARRGERMGANINEPRWFCNFASIKLSIPLWATPVCWTPTCRQLLISFSNNLPQSQSSDS